MTDHINAVRAYMPAHTRTLIDSVTGVITVEDCAVKKSATVNFDKKILVADEGIRDEIPMMLGVLLRAL